MPDARIQHFLIEYDILTGEVKVTEFGEDYDTALASYADVEQQMRDRDDLDIVLVGADSIETVARTHSSYFRSEETFESLLPPGVLVGS